MPICCLTEGSEKGEKKTKTQPKTKTPTKTIGTPVKTQPNYNECVVKKKRRMNPIDEILRQRIVQNSTPDEKITKRG